MEGPLLATHEDESPLTDHGHGIAAAIDHLGTKGRRTAILTHGLEQQGLADMGLIRQLDDGTPARGHHLGAAIYLHIQRQAAGIQTDDIGAIGVEPSQHGIAIPIPIHLAADPVADPGSLGPLGLHQRHRLSLRLPQHPTLLMDQQGSLGRGHILGVPLPLAGTQPQLGGRRLILQVGTIAQGRAATPPTLIAIDTVIETPVPGPSVEIQSGAGALSLLIGESAAEARRPQRVPDRDAEAQHVLIPHPLVQGVAGRQGQAAPVKPPVVAELEAAALPLAPQ